MPRYTSIAIALVCLFNAAFTVAWSLPKLPTLPKIVKQRIKGVDPGEALDAIKTATATATNQLPSTISMCKWTLEEGVPPRPYQLSMYIDWTPCYQCRNGLCLGIELEDSTEVVWVLCDNTPAEFFDQQTGNWYRDGCYRRLDAVPSPSSIAKPKSSSTSSAPSQPSRTSSTNSNNVTGNARRTELAPRIWMAGVLGLMIAVAGKG